MCGGFAFDVQFAPPVLTSEAWDTGGMPSMDHHRDDLSGTTAGLPGHEEQQPDTADDAVDVFSKLLARLIWRQLCGADLHSQDAESPNHHVSEPGI